jgi:NADP-dependent 3-hydroxy acid dehydrogenase YdfG
VVLVTGASSGIGRDFYLDLVRVGCRVVAAARRTDRLRSLCEEINASESASGPCIPENLACVKWAGTRPTLFGPAR